MGNTSTSSGTPICQLGGVGIYLAVPAGSPANTTLNPSSISDVTVSNFYCNTLRANNGWPLPDYEWEIEGGNASIHNVHNEFMGVAGMLIGGNTPGLGAQVGVATDGLGHISSCTFTGTAGTGYNRSGLVNFPVSAATGTGGDSVTAVGAQNLLTEDIEACRATGGGTTDNIRIASGGTYSGITLINTNEMSSAPTNVINDQTHAAIAGAAHGSASLYMLNDAGNVVFDSTGVNAVVLPGVFSSGGTTAKGSLGVPVVVGVDNSGPLRANYSNPIYTTPSANVRGFIVMQWAQQSILGTGCSGATTFTVNYVYTPAGQSLAITQPAGTGSISGNGTLGATLVMVDPHFLEVKQASSISASVTSFTPGTCTNAPGYTLFTKLIQTD